MFRLHVNGLITRDRASSAAVVVGSFLPHPLFYVYFRVRSTTIEVGIFGVGFYSGPRKYHCLHSGGPFLTKLCNWMDANGNLIWASNPPTLLMSKSIRSFVFRMHINMCIPGRRATITIPEPFSYLPSKAWFVFHCGGELSAVTLRPSRDIIIIIIITIIISFRFLILFSWISQPWENFCSHVIWMQKYSKRIRVSWGIIICSYSCMHTNNKGIHGSTSRDLSGGEFVVIIICNCQLCLHFLG